MILRRCSKCKVMKAGHKFPTLRTKTCTACREKVKQWQQDHPEERIAQNKRDSIPRREHMKLYQKAERATVNYFKIRYADEWNLIFNNERARVGLKPLQERNKVE